MQDKSFVRPDDWLYRYIFSVDIRDAGPLRSIGYRLIVVTSRLANTLLQRFHLPSLQSYPQWPEGWYAHPHTIRPRSNTKEQT